MMKDVSAQCRAAAALLILGCGAAAQSFSGPAGIRTALRRPEASILPGGRIVSPVGEQFPTGSGAFGMAVGPSGNTVVTANGGPGRNSLTVMERDRSGRWIVRQVLTDRRTAGDEDEANRWYGVFMGLAFSGDRSFYASEGNSGRVALLDLNGERRRTIDLNQGGFDDSYAGDLALDGERGILWAVDQANFRVVAIETRSRRILSSTRVGRLPFALAL